MNLYVITYCGTDEVDDEKYIVAETYYESERVRDALEWLAATSFTDVTVWQLGGDGWVVCSKEAFKD